MTNSNKVPAGTHAGSSAASANAASANAAPNNGALAPLILVVDDFEDNRAMYAEYLSFTGYRVEEAENGAEAVEKATRLLPDVIVMDLSLPVMDGWEATRRLKANDATKHIAVIALTGHSVAGRSNGAKEAGCDETLVKPCLPDTLGEKILDCLRTREVAREKMI